jgi:hypothetical protein
MHSDVAVHRRIAFSFFFMFEAQPTAFCLYHDYGRYQHLARNAYGPRTFSQSFNRAEWSVEIHTWTGPFLEGELNRIRLGCRTLHASSEDVRFQHGSKSRCEALFRRHYD